MSDEQEAAWRAALRDMAKADKWEVPHPSAVAFYLRKDLCIALVAARLGPEGYWVGEAHRDELFSRGIVAARSNYLTAFGHAVRRALIEDEA